MTTPTPTLTPCALDGADVAHSASPLSAHKRPSRMEDVQNLLALYPHVIEMGETLVRLCCSQVHLTIYTYRQAFALKSSKRAHRETQEEYLKKLKMHSDLQDRHISLSRAHLQLLREHKKLQEEHQALLRKLLKAEEKELGKIRLVLNQRSDGRD